MTAHTSGTRLSASVDRSIYHASASVSTAASAPPTPRTQIHQRKRLDGRTHTQLDTHAAKGRKKGKHTHAFIRLVLVLQHPYLHWRIDCVHFGIHFRDSNAQAPIQRPVSQQFGYNCTLKTPLSEHMHTPLCSNRDRRIVVVCYLTLLPMSRQSSSFSSMALITHLQGRLLS